MHSNVYPNTLFYKEGLLDINDKGMVTNYKAVCKSSDGSAYIYADDDIKDEIIIEILRPLLEKGIIEQIYTSEEAKKFGADSNCRFMIEASEGYFFLNPVREKVVVSTDEAKTFEKSIYKNNHGYSPHTKKYYETVFFISGKGIKKNIFIEEMNLVDEGPTFAKILGFEMNNIQGRPILEFLEV